MTQTRSVRITLAAFLQHCNCGTTAIFSDDVYLELALVKSGGTYTLRIF